MNNLQSVFPKNPNTLNLFLLDIGAPIIDHLENKSSELEPQFIAACLNNRLFASWRNASYGPDLVYGVDNYQREAFKIFDLTEGYLTAIQCHDCHYDKPSREELDEKLQNFLKKLIEHYDFKTFLEMRKNASIKAFSDDYKAIENRLLKGEIDYNTAQTSLLYWQDAVPELLLQEALTSFWYSRIALHLKLIKID